MRDESAVQVRTPAERIGDTRQAIEPDAQCTRFHQSSNSPSVPRHPCANLSQCEASPEYDNKTLTLLDGCALGVYFEFL